MTNEGLAILVPILVLGALFFIPIIMWAFGIWLGPRTCGYTEDELEVVSLPEDTAEMALQEVSPKVTSSSSGVSIKWGTASAPLVDFSTTDASVDAKREWRRAQLVREEAEASKRRREEDDRIMQAAVYNTWVDQLSSDAAPQAEEVSLSNRSSYETPSSSHSSWLSESPHSSHSTNWGSSSHSVSSDHSSSSSYSDHSSSSYSSSSYDSGSSYSSSDSSSSSSSGWD